MPSISHGGTERKCPAIGSDEVYGLIKETKQADAAKYVPQGVLDIEGISDRPIIRRAVEMNTPLTWDDVEIPANRMTELWERQKPLVGLK